MDDSLQIVVFIARKKRNFFLVMRNRTESPPWHWPICPGLGRVMARFYVHPCSVTRQLVQSLFSFRERDQMFWLRSCLVKRSQQVRMPAELVRGERRLVPRRPADAAPGSGSVVTSTAICPVWLGMGSTVPGIPKEPLVFGFGTTADGEDFTP
jgi:hypothetical protein